MSNEIQSYPLCWPSGGREIILKSAEKQLSNILGDLWNHYVVSI